MDLFTHILSGFFLLGITRWSTSPLLFVFAGLMAIFPDLDVFLIPLQKWTKSYYLFHRGASHSIFFAPLFSLLAAVIFQFGIDLPFAYLWLFGFSCCCLHLILDFSTVSTIPLFFPLSKKEFCLNIERSVSSYLLVFSFLTILLTIAWIRIFHPLIPQIPIDLFPIIIIIIYGVYFLHRVVIRVIIDTRLSPTQLFIPDLIPFAWGIYENYQQDSMQFYRLTPHSLWIHPRFPSYQLEIPIQSEEQQYITRALQVLQQFRFFHKWRGILPRIMRNDAQVVVYIGFAEGFSRNHQYHGKVIFDKVTNEILECSENFGQFIQIP